LDEITQHLNQSELEIARGELTLDFNDSIDRMIVKRKKMISALEKLNDIPDYLGAICPGLPSQRGTPELFPEEWICWDVIPTNKLPRDFEDFKRRFQLKIWLLRLPHWFGYYGSWLPGVGPSPMAFVLASTNGFYNLEILILHLDMFRNIFVAGPSILRHIVLPIFHSHPLSVFPLFNLIIMRNIAFLRLDQQGVLIRETAEFTDYWGDDNKDVFPEDSVSEMFLPPE
jgi:hypothetical protein